MKTSQVTPLLAGVAGEYYVAAELSARNHVASITLRNTRGVDILCSNHETTKTVTIQVKTNRSSRREWVLNQKSETLISDFHFYVFVCLNDGKKYPDFFIVPSNVVADQISTTHRSWLDTPGKNGRAHVDSSMRKFTDIKEVYLGRWDLLDL
jgi:hypothetical protein